MSVHLADFLDRPSVQAAVQRLAEELANHVCADQRDARATYHESLEALVTEAVEGTVRGLEVESDEPLFRGVLADVRDRLA